LVDSEHVDAVHSFLLNLLFGLLPKLFSGMHDSGLLAVDTHPASFRNAGPFDCE
jgi:hypothetical protein